MKNSFLFLFLFVSSTIIAQHISGIKIINHHYFNNLPSASGVELYDSSFYLVADDLPWLIQMNYEGDVINKYPVSGITTIENGRTPKNIKADFESMAFVKINQKDFFLIFSSGSRRVKRDTVSLFSLESKTVVAKKNLRNWFETIKNKSGMAATDEINIEGSAVINGKIYLAHRGNISDNFITVSPLHDFLQFLTGKSNAAPPVDVIKFKLPLHNGVAAGLSGMCGVPGDSGLLVTASLEATGDVVNDGVVLGSYLGYIPFNTLQKGKIYLTPITDENNNMIAKKQEGVALIKVDKSGNYRVLTVCDNDDGTSDIWQFEFKLN